jgi:hypothetical protein
MHSVNKLRVIGAFRLNLWSTENVPRAALGARIWTRLLAALHESRKREAARVIRRHRGLIQNFQAIELPGRGMDPKKPCMTRESSRAAGLSTLSSQP